MYGRSLNGWYMPSLCKILSRRQHLNRTALQLMSPPMKCIVGLPHNHSSSPPTFSLSRSLHTQSKCEVLPKLRLGRKHNNKHPVARRCNIVFSQLTRTPQNRRLQSWLPPNSLSTPALRLRKASSRSHHRTCHRTIVRRYRAKLPMLQAGIESRPEWGKPSVRIITGDLSEDGGVPLDGGFYSANNLV
jgi:hypothetical protein